MKIKYERIVKQVCEIELTKDEFKNEFENDATNVLDWGEETREFDVVSEQYPDFFVTEIKDNSKGISFKELKDEGYDIDVITVEKSSIRQSVKDLENLSLDQFESKNYQLDYENLKSDEFKTIEMVVITTPLGGEHEITKDKLIEIMRESFDINDFRNNMWQTII